MEREGEKGLNTVRRVERGENPLRPRLHLLQDRQRNEESNATRIKEFHVLEYSSSAGTPGQSSSSSNSAHSARSA